MAHFFPEFFSIQEIYVAIDIDQNALKEMAKLYRREILELTYTAKCGHPGGSLSSVEILIALYAYKMNHRPNQPKWEDRDRLIISKGHVTPVVYVALANQGYFSKNEYKLYRKFGGILQGHVHPKVPGVEFGTGSLGHGLSVTNGIALGARLQKKSFKVYCLLGDGELQEGSVWEAAMFASHHKLDNVCAIVDYNHVQENGPTNEIKNLEPLAKKWESFGWHVVECNGHDFGELFRTFDAFGTIKNKPFVVIAHTIKGEGVSYMKNSAKWHGKAPNEEQLKTALSEIDNGGPVA